MLDGRRADLGLPEGCRLRTELHSMLVYAPGQFFLPHQDSEKADEMVGTLVVTLPGSFQGGALVVEHRGKKRTYRGTPKSLSFVAFYADCLHEVRPVTEGYRIVLTYNLMLQGDGTVDAAAGAPPEAVDTLAGRLRAHFETPLPPCWAWPKDAPPREPPDRLVYLLDHQYTERGFGWSRLKGEDAAHVATLRAAAERAGCEVFLALAEVHESWSCFEPGWDEPRYGRHRRWGRDEDHEWAADYDVSSADDPDAYDLQDLIDSEITLDRWIDASGKRDRPTWLAALLRLCEALCLADEAAGPPAARLLLEDSWSWLRGEIEGRRKYERPRFRDEALAKLARPLLAFLEGAALVGTAELRDEAVEFLSAEKRRVLVPFLVGTLRAQEADLDWLTGRS